MATTSCTKLLVPILLLAVLLTLGLVFEFMGQLLGGLIKSQFQLATNKHVQRLWAKPPIKVRTAYWLYDIENPELVSQFVSTNYSCWLVSKPQRLSSAIKQKQTSLFSRKKTILTHSYKQQTVNDVNISAILK